MYQLTYTGNEVDSLLTTINNNNNNLNNLDNQSLLLQQQNTDILNMINSLDNYYNPKAFIDKTYPVGTIYKAKSGIDPNALFGGTKWETVENISDKEYINNYFGTTNLEVITHNDGTKWVPIVQHCVDSGSTLYSGVAQAKQCSTVGKISNLYLFEKTHNIFKNSNGQYEFILEYPEWQNWNRWKQTSSPLANTITGYSAVKTTWSKSGFWGISISSSPSATYLDCGGSNNWWYAICSFENYNNGIPGPEISANDTITKYFTYLYVRVPSLEKSNITTTNADILNQVNYIEWKRIS